MARVFVGDINTKIKLDVGTDISSALKIEIHYKKPNGDIGKWSAVLEGTDYIYYLTKSDDLDENGVWEVQAYIEFSTWKGHGEITSFSVYEALQKG